ncbi:MAG: transporter substrate-binding domain-containing protein [Betaproteobacteria bacterium]|nr:transporter substrate-binding domain-containing protein [Betaproteobacteria bacterium]
MHRTLPTLVCSVLAVGAALPRAAQAACSRVIHVPISATGQSVIVDGDTIKGIYPDLLRSLADKDGCTVALSAVPRARQEILFETGRADLLIPASRTPKRDMHGSFIPLIRNRAMLISLRGSRPAIKTMQDLVDRPGFKVALVRGFDYGQTYQDLISTLTLQGRLILEVDALSVARLLKSGAADATIMTPSILAGALQDDERVQDLLDRLQFEALPELPWGHSGVYLSNSTLNPRDLAALRAALERAAKSGVVWRGFQQYYAPAVLNGSIRPL